MTPLLDTRSGEPADAPLLADLDALVARASDGDARAIFAVAIAFGGALYDEACAAAGAGHDDPLPHEALQQLFTRLGAGAPRFHPPPGRPLTWLRAMTRACVRGQLRRRGGHSSTQGEPVMDHSQIDRIYRKHIVALVESARDIVGSHDVAEDVAHDAFVELVEGEGDLVATDARVLACVEGIVLRRAREHVSDHARAPDTEREVTPPTQPSPGAPPAVLEEDVKLAA